jgi:hypothetical protein
VQSKIDLPDFISESLDIQSINASAFEPWVFREISNFTSDDFVADIVMGFLRGKTINSQDFAQTLQPSLGDATVPFVSLLWTLLLDGKPSDLEIPKVILDEKNRRAAVQRAAMSESSSDSGERRRFRPPEEARDAADDRTRRHRHHHDHQHHRHHSRRRRRHRSDSD